MYMIRARKTYKYTRRSVWGKRRRRLRDRKDRQRVIRPSSFFFNRATSSDLLSFFTNPGVHPVK